MAFEIEHKYLVMDDSFMGMAVSSRRIVQGYLSSRPDCVVRVRIYGDEAFLTVKGRNHGDTRLELEYHIPMEDAQKMLPLCEGKVLEKVRYIVPYHGFTWEVDVFEGHRRGLVTAEIELPASDTHYDIPPFVGENVTGNPEYFNSNL